MVRTSHLKDLLSHGATDGIGTAAGKAVTGVVISSAKWGSSQAGRRWSTFTRSKTWRRFSSRRRILRAVMIAEPELGDRIMRALILRRVVVIETGAGGPVLIGPEDAPDVVRLQGSSGAHHIIPTGKPFC